MAFAVFSKLKAKCCCLGLFGCILLVFILSWSLNSGTSSQNGEDEETQKVRRTLGLLDFTHLSGDELKKRIEELLRIKDSVQLELHKLEEQRNEMQIQISAFVRKIEELRTVASHEQIELDKLKLSIQQAKVVQRELTERNTPQIKAPLPIRASEINRVLVKSPTENQRMHCRMRTCFDYSRCSLVSGMPVYFYNNFTPLEFSGFLTNNPDEACLFVVLVDDAHFQKSGLSHWNGDGRNHILVDPSGSLSGTQGLGRAIIASHNWTPSTFRPIFDLALPSLSNLSSYELTNLVPVRRKFLLTFIGESVGTTSELDTRVLDILSQINTDKTDDQVYVRTNCTTVQGNNARSNKDFSLCQDEAYRKSYLTQSTFQVIMTPGSDISSSQELQIRLYESLKYGAIPVILDGDDLALPFAERIDWPSTIILFPTSRITELHFYLRSFPDSDLFHMRRKGRLIWETYLSSRDRILSTMLHVMRERLQIPAPVVEEAATPSVFNESFQPLITNQLPEDIEPGESYGPLEPPYPSPSFKRNFSSLIVNGRQTWNDFFCPFRMTPFTPWEPILPTEAQFLGSSPGFRPIGGGEGGSGKEFSQAIGGNSPQEQFTVVMLTYEREQVLVDSLARLHGLPYLNKVVVVWNSRTPPMEDLQWPDIGVPIRVVRTEKNSLNNRFLPFDAIETEAVLSVDDDAHLRHDEIIFGFRVWREHRDRLVGFPGRFHAWDFEHRSWNYNSNYSCELSMVLTGAAFYHKYYSYAYSQLMPQVIRDKVDEFMNCEDLAMNFLISHMTRKPPVKVTSRWTFRCPGCPVSLSEDETHFLERHDCINFFSKVYGYTPLLFTQYRADSVLFKTRIPQDKQKCFKFI